MEKFIITKPRSTNFLQYKWLNGEQPNWKLQYPLKKDSFLLFLIMCTCTQVCAGAEGSQRHQCLWISLELELRVLASHPTWVLDRTPLQELQVLLATGLSLQPPPQLNSSLSVPRFNPYSRREFYFLKKSETN